MDHVSLFNAQVLFDFLGNPRFDDAVEDSVLGQGSIVEREREYGIFSLRKTQVD